MALIGIIKPARQLKAFIQRSLSELKKLPLDQVVDNRLQRFRNIGKFTEKVYQEQVVEKLTDSDQMLPEQNENGDGE